MAGESAKRRPTKADVVANGLRTMIARGEVGRGARVPQDELAARFQTSITPVREAIRRLEAEGLLVGQPHRGVRVASANLEAVRGVYIARRLLEPYASERATLRASRRDLTVAEELGQRMTEAIQSNDHAAVLDANLEFHFHIYRLCGVPSLVSVIESLWVAYPWDVLEVAPGRMAQSEAEHAAILDAIKDGDPARVGEAFSHHLAHSYLVLARHLSSADVPDVFDVNVD